MRERGTENSSEVTMSMRANKRAGLGRRPRLEVLEERCTPATASGAITGVAFVDSVVRNGVYNAGEAALPGAIVTLTGTTAQGVPVPKGVFAIADRFGHYTFNNVLPGSYQVTAAPMAGFTPALQLSLPALVITTNQVVSRNVGFGVPLTASLSTRMFLTNSGSVSLGLPGIFTTGGTGLSVANYRPNNNPVLMAGLSAIPDATVGKGADKLVDLAGFITDPDMTNDLVTIKTTAGDIHLQLFDAYNPTNPLDTSAPRTVANFLNYIKTNHYDNSIFHRLDTSPQVLQGGGFGFDQATHQFVPLTPGDKILTEYSTSRENVKFTIAMAKQGGDPNSATDQFFFNLADNTSILNDAGQGATGGFTVFGKLLGPADQAVLSALTSLPVKDGTPASRAPRSRRSRSPGTPARTSRTTRTTTTSRASPTW